MKNFENHSKLHNLKQGEELSILKTDFKSFKQEVTFDDLVLTKRIRSIGYAGEEELPFEITQQIGGIDFHGYKSSYEALGLYLLGLLFSTENYIHLKLPREQSEMEELFLYVERRVGNDFSLKSEPQIHTSYEYFRDKVEKFPLSGVGFSERILREEDTPVFLLGWSDYNRSHQPDNVKHADQLIV